MMPKCLVCDGDRFENHEGYFYCTECQTQSQDVQEQIYEFRQGDVSRHIGSRKPRKRKDKPKKTLEGPDWTSWEAFNYILRGMTEELLTIGAPLELETKVLELWACQLRKAEVAFLHRFQVKKPRLGSNFKSRDGQVLKMTLFCLLKTALKILYDLDIDAISLASSSCKSSRSKKRTRSTTSSTTNKRALKVFAC